MNWNRKSPTASMSPSLTRSDAYGAGESVCMTTGTSSLEPSSRVAEKVIGVRYA